MVEVSGFRVRVQDARAYWCQATADGGLFVPLRKTAGATRRADARQLWSRRRYRPHLGRKPIHVEPDILRWYSKSLVIARRGSTRIAVF